MFIVVIVTSLLAPILFPIFFGDKWQGSYPLFALMGGVVIFSSLLSLARSDLYAQKAMKAITLGKFFELLISCLLIFSLGVIGLKEMAIASSLRYLIVFIIVYWFVIKITKKTTNNNIDILSLLLCLFITTNYIPFVDIKY
jgi:O-antigen/teichoic acid export membrane protein